MPAHAALTFPGYFPCRSLQGAFRNPGKFCFGNNIANWPLALFQCDFQELRCSGVFRSLVVFVAVLSFRKQFASGPFDRQFPNDARGGDVRMFVQRGRVDMEPKAAAAWPDVVFTRTMMRSGLSSPSASFFAVPRTTRAIAPKAPLPLRRSSGSLPAVPFVK